MTVPTLERLRPDVAAGRKASREAEIDALRRENERLKAIMGASREGFAIIDCDDRIVVHNARFLELLGAPEHITVDARGVPIDHLLDERVRAALLQQLGDYRSCRRAELQHRGKTVEVITRCPSDGDEINCCQNADHAALVVNDITEVNYIKRLAAAVEQTHDSVVITDRAGDIVYVNPMFSQVTGYARDEAIGSNPRILKSGEHDPEFYRVLWATLTAGKVWRGELKNRRKDGTVFVERATISPIVDGGEVVAFVAVKTEISDQLMLEAQVRHSQKLEAIGQLAAGIAHEINTPMQYIGDNIVFLERASKSAFPLIATLREVVAEAKQGGSEALARAEAQLAAVQMDFLLAQVPLAFEQCCEGVDHVRKIVSAMRSFSHPSQGKKMPVDINEAISTTVTVARNEWKYAADVELDLEAGLPPVLGLRDELNQAFLNIIVNAAHAIADAIGRRNIERGRISISTRATADSVEIRFVDTGTGIPEAAQPRVFDPFFTTKAVGQGTGQGLAIAHAVVVEMHGGSIDFETETDVGTTFRVSLPQVGEAEV